MNDELTPSERAALRSRILGGARDIKPAGAHRNAWIAGSVAAVLVAAIAGGVVATSTLSAPQIANTPTPSPTATVAPVVPTPTPTSTPTPTQEPTPSAPVVAFDGDCTQVLNDAEARDLMLAGAAAPDPDRDIATNSADSLALLGGLSCVWVEEGDAITVVAAAPSAISPDLMSSLSSVSCSIDDGCRLARIEGDIWVAARVSAYPDDFEAGFTSNEVSAATTRLERVLATVAGKPHKTPVAAIESVSANGWALSDCGALQNRLERVIGSPLTMQGPDGTSLVPDRLVDRILASSARVTTCAYRDSAENSRGSIIVTLMPGVSTPAGFREEMPDAVATTVEGADRAWAQVLYDHVYTLDLVAAVGDDRLTLRRTTQDAAVTDAEQIAATVLEFLR